MKSTKCGRKNAAKSSHSLMSLLFGGASRLGHFLVEPTVALLIGTLLRRPSRYSLN